MDLRELRLADLRGAFGLVSRDVFLFHGSVRDNIAYDRPEASDAEAVEAARVAEAHDFIQALPQGYDTVVGSAEAHDGLYAALWRVQTGERVHG